MSEFSNFDLLEIKPGIGPGGASISDVLMLDAYRSATGESVGMVVGSSDRLIEEIAHSREIPVVVDTAFDRNTTLDPNVRAEKALYVAQRSKRLILSQFFADSEVVAGLAESAVLVSKERPIGIRQANELSEPGLEAIARIEQGSTFVPIHSFMAERTRRRNPSLGFVVVSAIYDENRVAIPSKSVVTTIREQVRSQYEVNGNDIMLIQPTTVSSFKGIDAAIDLTRRLEGELHRSVVLVVAGNPKQTEKTEKHTEYLMQLASRNEPVAIRFGGQSKRHSDYYSFRNLCLSADVATHLSSIDNTPLALMEMAAMRMPTVTRRFDTEQGDPTFEIIYREFDFIVDPEVGASVDQTTVNKVAQIIEDDSTYRPVLEKNVNAARHFTTTGIASQMRDLSKMLLGA